MEKFKDFKYVRPNIESISKQLEDLTKVIKTASEYAAVSKTVHEYFDISRHYETMGSLCSVRNSIDTVDEFYEKETDFFNQNGPVLQNSFNNYEKELVKSPFRKELVKEFGEYFFIKIETGLAVFDEKIVPDLVKENKLTTEYDKLIASAKIPYKGKVYNLSQMGIFTSNIDRDVRRESSKLVSNFFEENEKEFDRIYDELVQVRDHQAKLMGFKNYVEFGYKKLGRTDYGSADVAEYRKQIYESLVPVVSEIIKEQGKRINIPDMQSYDLSLEFLDGNPTPKGSRDELVSKALTMYSEMSPETKEFFTLMVERELMDLDSKPGKQGGGYCTEFADYKVPFIFANFNGTKHDVDVLTHEAGHAFQSYESSKVIENPQMVFPTLEACEIHSMSMEFLAYPWMESFFKEDTKKYKFSHVRGALTFIPYGATVDEFQHFVYENPSATPKERKDEWRKLQLKYTPYIKYDESPFMQKGTRWFAQGHIFSVPFYYIDYTLAQVCALQFYLASVKDRKEAWGRYIKLCRLGGSRPFLELVKEAGLENPFVPGTISKIVKELQKIM